MSKVASTYQNAKGETILVLENGFKVKQSLAAQAAENIQQERSRQKAELRKQWLEFCAKYGMNPDD